MNYIKCFVTIAILVICQSVTAQKAWRVSKNELIFENPPFAQCHASTLVETKPGEVMAAWFAGSNEGNNDVKIWVASNVNGKWSTPIVLSDGKISDGQTFPCWNPVLFKTNNDELFLFYKVGPNPREWWGMYKKSFDNGISWSTAFRLPNGVLGPVKNKPIQLSDGTILSPSSTESNTEVWKAHIERSTDQGKTWQIIPVDHESKFNVIQPSILTHSNGHLQILCRSKEGNVIQAWSSDNGLTWSKLTRTNLLNPNSGTDAVTLADQSHLIVYNPLVPGREWFNGRFKLNTAISNDGVSWKDIIILEEGTKEEYSYPAIIQTKDGKIHISYTFDRKNIKHIILE